MVWCVEAFQRLFGWNMDSWGNGFLVQVLLGFFSLLNMCRDVYAGVRVRV